MLATTVATRSRAVQQARANFAIEGFQPDAVDVALLAGYISGVITLADMLQHARDFVASEKSVTAQKPDTGTSNRAI